MKLDRKSTVFISSLLLPAISGNETEAGTVKIINESEQNIRVDVIPHPGGASYCKKCFNERTSQCGKHTAEINVPLEACKGLAYFSLVDVGNGLIGGGKCKNLNTSKNYEIIFFETTLGTYCESREI